MTGQRWLRFARRWLDESTVERMIEPLIADWQHELRPAHGWPKLRATLRGHLAVARSIGSCLLRESRQPLPSGVTAKAWYVIEAFAALGVFLAAVITAYSSDSVSRVPFGVVLPDSLVVSLPLAAVPLLVMMTRFWNVTPHVARWLAVRTALLLTLTMIPLAGWIAPRTHHGWRESVVGHELPLSLRQMTLTELWTQDYGNSPRNSAARKHEANSRVSRILMPISLSVLGLAVAAHTRRRAFATIGRAIGGATLWWMASLLLWFASFPAGAWLLRATALDTIDWTPLLVPCGPHLMLLLVSVALSRLQRKPVYAY